LSKKIVAVVLAGHGSKTRGFDAAMERVAVALRSEKIFSEVHCAFLEAAPPSIQEAIDRCVERGAHEVRVLPYFVLTGKHVLRDIPLIVQDASRRHAAKAKISLCPYLGYHPKLVSVVKQRIREGKQRALK
jgi:sirohydrochlorin ferrochelatase